DHDCIGVERKKDQQAQRKAEIRNVMAKHADSFAQQVVAEGSLTGTRSQQQQRQEEGTKDVNSDKKTETKVKLSAKEIIEAAKAKVAQRATTVSVSMPAANAEGAKTATKQPTATVTPSSTEKPKTKRPSRAMTLIQLRKVAQVIRKKHIAKNYQRLNNMRK
ncbi:hypothetical protein BGW42_004948, partial [Actinomortierella wolfii]